MSKIKSCTGLLAALGAAGLIGTLTARKLSRALVNRLHDEFMTRITSDLYEENLWEVVSSTVRIGPQVVLETSLRAQEGKLIERPMGPPRKFPDMEDIKFDFAQLYTMPTKLEAEIDISAVIGPQARKPLEINHFMMIAPMAYGIALSRRMKIALAKGTAAAGTATHTGAGAFLEEERDAAKYLIYQYNRGDWGNTADIMCRCDAIEIQLGQGAYGGTGHIFKSRMLDAELRREYNKKRGENLITHSRQPEVQSPKELKRLIDKLRTITDGLPIGVKIAAGKHLEADLYWVCFSGADFVVVDGAEAASKGSPPILQDDFGVPTAFAVDRAANWMRKNGYKDKVSLIASGRIRTPGDALKVRALGADACQIGAIALVAASNQQTNKAMPFEPPTAVAFYGEADAYDFDIDQGAKYLANFLESCKLEMAEGIRALGKTSINEVDKSDLMATSEMYAKALDIPMVYDPFNPEGYAPRVRRIKL